MTPDKKHKYPSIEIEIEIEPDITIRGNLTVPKASKALVLFAHGSGSGRFSPRNQYVAGVLNDAQLATLLIDLLTEQEELIDLQTRQLRFDIPLLTARVEAATEFVLTNKAVQNLPIGYFGASTGAAAALAAAADLKDHIYAVVSRGGRPDLAHEKIPAVKAPTLLIVGGNDFLVIEINQRTAEMLTCKNEILIIPGAGHLFEEPGTLQKAAEASAKWFRENLKPIESN